MTKFFVKFKTTGKIYQFSSSSKFKPGEKILMKTDQGIEIGTTLDIDKKTLQSPSFEIEELEGEILRKLTQEDEEKLVNLKPKAEKAFLFCQQKIKELRLPMRLISAEYSLDEKKLTFYFTAEERVDFRELLGELVSYFHRNIRLQQLGPRDTAKIIGGIGPCGRPLCCQTFLENMESVTLEMAKEQNLAAVGSSKISGLCGKLMCCLVYEAEAYEKMRKNLPEIGSEIKTEKGKGKVIAQNVLKQSILAELQDGTKLEVKCTK